jgi:choline dehydrogenase-like flavoprotein
VPGSAPEPGRNYMTVFTNLISPFSRGTVTLSSSNPLDAPVINPNFLANDFDVHTMVAAVAASKLFLSASAWKGYVVAPWGPLANVTDLASAETFARQNAGR